MFPLFTYTVTVTYEICDRSRFIRYFRLMKYEWLLSEYVLVFTLEIIHFSVDLNANILRQKCLKVMFNHCKAVQRTVTLF